MRAIIAVAAAFIAAVLLYPAAPSSLAEGPIGTTGSTGATQVAPKPKPCSATQAEFRSYARAVYRRSSVSKKALATIDRRRGCASSKKASRNMLAFQRSEGRKRFKRMHPWDYEWSRVPAALKARLAALRGCETRGIPYPQNYQWRGHHHGAYQYDARTWQETGGSGYAYDASPREQDVRTAWFFPSHTGRWECKA